MKTMLLLAGLWALAACGSVETSASTSTGSGGSGGAASTWFCAGSVACCSNPACPAPNLCECVFDEQVIAASAEDAAQLLLQECRDHHLDKSCGLWSLICDDKPVDPGPCP